MDDGFVQRIIAKLPEEYDDRIIIQPGAFRRQVDIPVKMGYEGPAIGKADMDEEGNLKISLFVPLSDILDGANPSS